MIQVNETNELLTYHIDILNLKHDADVCQVVNLSLLLFNCSLQHKVSLLSNSEMKNCEIVKNPRILQNFFSLQSDGGVRQIHHQITQSFVVGSRHFNR